MNATSSIPSWLRPESPVPTFIFLGTLILLVLALLVRTQSDYRVASSDPTSAPFQLSRKSQFLDPLGERKLTAADQSREPSELALINDIRSRILQDRNLSQDARKTLVITNEEAVTLRGVVHSPAEKQVVGHYAEAATTKRINNQLEIH